MRSPGAYYLILIYLAALCKPVMPFVCDFLQHNFNVAEHIAVVHQGKGKNHVHIDVKNAASENNKDNSASVRFSEEIAAHIPVQYLSLISKELIITTPNSIAMLVNLPFTYSTVQVPPPKA